MSSLISPGPGTPGQGPFLGPWLSAQDWPSLRGGFGTLQDTSQSINRDNFSQNLGDDYSPQEASAAQAGPFMSNVAQNKATTQPMHGQSQAASTHLSRTQHSNSSATGSPKIPTQEAAAENAKKLKDLRAQLLAKKTKESQEQTPAPISASADSRQTPTASASPKTVPKTTSSYRGTPKEIINKAKEKPDAAQAAIGQAPVADKDGTIAGLDHLFAEVRSEIDNAQMKAAQPAKTQVNGASATSAKATPNARTSGTVNRPHRPSPAQEASSSDLSEGEIRSDEETARASKSDLGPKKPDISEEASLESEEKSRRESEVEAAYKKPAAPSRDSQEKMRRVSQVDLAYSPLRKSSAASGKSGKLPLDTSAVHRKLNNLDDTPKSAVESSSRPWIPHSKPRAAEYDSYVPASRKSGLNDHAPSENLILGKRTATGDRVDTEAKRRAVEKNEKAAMEYKRALEARPQPERVISHTDTTYLGTVENERHENSKLAVRSNEVADNPDIRDWLELTEYYDENYRQSRLARFRKKKELEKMQMQLEEEEQQEQQQRSKLKTTAVSVEPGTQATKMAPPALSLRFGKSSSNTDPQIATVVSDAGAVVTPTLKRHHAEENTDPRNKVARVDTTRGNAALVKDETSPLFSSIPFEDRISRDDGRVGSRQRRRTRSPDRYRRRSLSPEVRRNSVPDFLNKKTCHNCSEPGHYQTTCPYPRRDGRDRYRGPPKARYDGVSPNYVGKKPQQGFRDPRATIGYSSVNRPPVDDDDKRP